MRRFAAAHPELAHDALRELSLTMARMVNPGAEVVGISINTAGLGEAEALGHLAEVEARMGLPTVDPSRQGAGRLVNALA